MRPLIPLVLALAACAGGSVRDEAGDASVASPVFADSLRGTLRITGPEPGVTFVVVDAAGRGSVVEGDRAMLERLAGVEIAVFGTRTPHAFQVGEVAVRAVEGVPAVDGVLAREDGRDVVVLRDGSRRVVARLPQALRGLVGARVWLTGTLDGDVVSFGILQQPR